MEQHFLEFSERRTTLGGIQKSSKISYREIPFHMTPFAISRILNCSLFRNQATSGFQEIPLPYAPVSKFAKLFSE